MKTFVVVVLILIVGLAYGLSQPRTIRKYTVRENITANSFELWCWSDLSNNKVSKKLIGSFSFDGVIETPALKTNLC